MNWLTIKPTHTSRKYKGQRARRQAFYRRQKVARVMTRMMREIIDQEMESMRYHMADAVAYGWSAFKFEAVSP